MSDILHILNELEDISSKTYWIRASITQDNITPNSIQLENFLMLCGKVICWSARIRIRENDSLLEGYVVFEHELEERSQPKVSRPPRMLKNNLKVFLNRSHPSRDISERLKRYHSPCFQPQRKGLGAKELAPEDPHFNLVVFDNSSRFQLNNIPQLDSAPITVHQQGKLASEAAEIGRIGGNRRPRDQQAEDTSTAPEPAMDNKRRRTETDFHIKIEEESTENWTTARFEKNTSTLYSKENTSAAPEPAMDNKRRRTETDVHIKIEEESTENWTTARFIEAGYSVSGILDKRQQLDVRFGKLRTHYHVCWTKMGRSVESWAAYQDIKKWQLKINIFNRRLRNA